MEPSHILIFLAFFVVHSVAVPFGNAIPIGNVTTTIYGTKPGLEFTFAPDPRGRGTVEILITCTSTFFFCIWTAVHPNILPGASSPQRFKNQFVLMIISIILPEGVLVLAFGELRDALYIQKRWKKKHFGNPEKYISLQVAFFVVMGGFAIDKEEPERPGDFTILTPKGFIKCMEKDYIHDKTFDKDSIADKNKANWLTKTLATIQALYMVVGCASRWYFKLPLTLLEVHVLVQVVRTALIYGFWWRKPRDIEAPIKIKLGKAPAESVAMEDVSMKQPIVAVSQLSEDNSVGQREGLPEQKPVSNGEPDSELDLRVADLRATKLRRHELMKQDAFTTSTPRYFVAYPALAICDILAQIDAKEENTKKQGREMRRRRQRSLAFRLLGSLLVSVTGVLHATAWNSSIPTPVEQWLWRVSSLTMCCFCLGLFLIANFSKYEDSLITSLLKFAHTDFSRISPFRRVLNLVETHCEERADGVNWKYYLRQLTICLCFFVVFIYFFPVLFITLEAYVSLRSPVTGTFWTPSWSNYWPHL